MESLQAQEGFDGIAQDLEDILGALWEALALAAAAEVAGILGAAAFGRQVAAAAIDAMREYLGEEFPAQASPFVREAIRITYGAAQDEFGVVLATSLNLTDRRAQRWLHQHHMYWVREHFDAHVTERLTRLADTALSQGLSRVNAGRLFRNELAGTLGQSDAYWRLTADAITTRSRSFGSIEAMQKAGIDRYMIDAVVDHRTSEICEYLDGRVFEVAEAAAIRDRMIDAETPEEAKQVMPWMRPEDVVDRSESELVALGVMVPPFHGNCRSRLVRA